MTLIWTLLYMLHFNILLNDYINGSFNHTFNFCLYLTFLNAIFFVIGCRYEVFSCSRKCIIRNVRIHCDFDGKLIGLWALKLVLSSAKLFEAIFTFAFVRPHLQMLQSYCQILIYMVTVPGWLMLPKLLSCLTITYLQLILAHNK